MNIIVVLAVVVFVATVLIFCRKIQIRLREMTTKADFYERLYRISEICSRDQGGCISPCVDEGLAYINSISSKERRTYVKQEVYELLDSIYNSYLHMLNRQADSCRGKDKEAWWNKELYLLFENNRHWLAFDEEVCDWYDASAFKPSKKVKSPNRLKKALLEKREACERRFVEEKVAEEDRFRKNEEERIRYVLQQKRMKGFWACMAEIGPS